MATTLTAATDDDYKAGQDPNQPTFFDLEDPEPDMNVPDYLVNDLEDVMLLDPPEDAGMPAGEDPWPTEAERQEAELITNILRQPTLTPQGFD